MTTPTDHDLNVSLARLMGWTNCTNQNHTDDYPASQCWVRPGGDPAHGGELPDWSGSLDALFAPGGPVEYAREKGWGIELTIEAGNESDNWNAWATHNAIDAAHAYGPRPAEALATALHEAFMKEQG